MRTSIILLVVLLSSCYSQKIANRQLNKAYIYHNGLTAQKFSQWFPCETLQIDSSEKIQYIYKTDTLLKYILTETEPINRILQDTLIRYYNGCDSLKKELRRGKNLIDHLTEQIKIKPIVYYKTIVDSARNVSLQTQLNEANAELKKKSNNYLISLWFIIGLLIALIISLLINFFK
jgi:hypothetical protein